MRHRFTEEMFLSAVALLMAGIPPNLFPAAQAGMAKLSVMGVWLLLPSAVLLLVVLVAAALRGHSRLTNRLVWGGIAGFLATLGLEAVRATSFHVFAGMPGDMPRLLGVLLTDRFMLGPSALSDVLGWTYHFWNGVCFGIVFAVVFGRRSYWPALIYAQLIGIGFLLSPAVKALGIGFMGVEMPRMPLTVSLAHLAYGLILGTLCRRWIRDPGWLFSQPARRTSAEIRESAPTAA